MEHQRLMHFWQSCSVTFHQSPQVWQHTEKAHQVTNFARFHKLSEVKILQDNLTLICQKRSHLLKKSKLTKKLAEDFSSIFFPSLSWFGELQLCRSQSSRCIYDKPSLLLNCCDNDNIGCGRRHMTKSCVSTRSVLTYTVFYHDHLFSFTWFHTANRKSHYQS